MPSNLQIGLLPFALPEVRIVMGGAELLMAISLTALSGNGILEKQEWLLQQTPAVVADYIRRHGFAATLQIGDLMAIPAGYMVLSWPLCDDSGTHAGCAAYWAGGGGGTLGGQGRMRAADARQSPMPVDVARLSSARQTPQR